LSCLQGSAEGAKPALSEGVARGLQRRQICLSALARREVRRNPR